MFIAAYWGERKESRTKCAFRIAQAIDLLAQIHPELSVWYLKKSKKTISPKKIDGKSEIERNMRANKRDSDGLPIYDLGFSLGLWNGSNSFPCSFNVACGAYSEFVKNSVVLQFPENNNILPYSEIRRCLVAIVSVLDPDFALVTSHEYIDHNGGGAPWDAGGWLVYKRSDDNNNIEEHGTFGFVQ